MKPLLPRRVCAALALLALTACPMKSAIWLMDGEEAGRPVFGVGASRDGRTIGELDVFRLEKCQRATGDSTTQVWAIRRVMDVAPPRQLAYGVVPRGYQQFEGGPSRLPAGCYDASVNETGRLRFIVGPDRRAVEAF